MHRRKTESAVPKAENHGTRKEEPLLGIRMANWRFRRLDPRESRAFVTAALRDLRRLLLATSTGKARRLAETAEAEPDCPVVEVEYRLCEVEGQGWVWCRCELHQCPDGSSYWTCEPIAP